MAKIKALIIVILLVGSIGVYLFTSMKPVEEHHEDDAPESLGTEENEPEEELPSKVDRYHSIPEDVVKVTPEDDPYQPILHSPLWRDPVPMEYPINTAGAEDSPFVAPCGCVFYWFFTPDPSIPAELQVIDGVTGIYYSAKVDGGWSEPQLLDLSEGGIALDGCPYVGEGEIWWCSVRPGNFREIDIWIADIADGVATNIRNGGERINTGIGVGELHIASNGTEIYFHSDMPGGVGGRDIWLTRLVDGEWQDAENVEAVNTEGSDSLPFITQDGEELWFTRWYMGYPAIYRSMMTEGVWSEPELIISIFAAEPTLDAEGNIYFAHHFIQDGVMLEADIYVAHKRQSVDPLDAPIVPLEGYLLGSLPIPSEEQTFDEVYSQTSEHLDLVPVWGRPTPYYELAEELNGSWGDTFVQVYIRGNGMAPLVHISFIGPEMSLSAPQGSEGATLSDEEWRLGYLKAIMDVVEISRPRYLSIGNEVNRWYERYGLDGPNGFQHFVSLYHEAYEAVKEISPETKVFCTFAREMVSENREADMNVLELFDPDTLDMLVLTSYPHSLQGVNSPQDLPDDYYVNVSQIFPGKSLGFSEIAWPSTETFGGEQGQSDFLEQLTGRLTKGLDVEFISWSWMTDLNEMDDTGLIYRDGTPKQAYEVWRSLKTGE